MKYRIIGIFFVISLLIPAISFASTSQDTAQNIGGFYTNSIKGATTETLQMFSSVKDFYMPIVTDSVSIYSNIGLKVVDTFDVASNGVKDVGDICLQSFSLGLQKTGESVGDFSVAYADAVKNTGNDTLAGADYAMQIFYGGKPQISKTNTRQVSDGVSADTFGVIENLPLAFGETLAFTGNVAIDAYTDTIQKTGNAFGGIYNSTYELTSEILHSYVAGIGFVWTNVADKLSTPLVPLFYVEPVKDISVIKSPDTSETQVPKIATSSKTF